MPVNELIELFFQTKYGNVKINFPVKSAAGECLNILLAWNLLCMNATLDDFTLLLDGLYSLIIRLCELNNNLKLGPFTMNLDNMLAMTYLCISLFLGILTVLVFNPC